MADSEAWNSGWTLGSQLAQGIQERRARKQALSDEEFQMKTSELGTQLNNLRQKLGTLKPGSREYSGVVSELQTRIGEVRELYHPDKNPGAIARYGHLLTDKLGLTNSTKRIEKSGAQRANASAADEHQAQQMAEAAPLTPEQRAEQQARATTAGSEVTRAWALDWAKRHGVAEAALQELTEHLAGVPTRKPVVETEAAKTRADFAEYQKAHPDYKGTFEQWKTGQAAQGRAEVPKRQSNDDQFISIEQKRASGQQLSADESAFETAYKTLIRIKVIDPKIAGYAALGGSRMMQVEDPGHPGESIIVTGAEARRRGLHGTASASFKIAMPTSQERGRADLAVSAREQLDTMEDILTRRTDLFGPAAGRATDFTVWLGSQDPDAQRFRAAAKIASDHLAGVFGGRSEAALEGIHSVIGENLTNPQAAIAGLEQMNIAAGAIQGRGSVGGAGGAPTPGALKKQAQKNLGTDPLGVL
jgi:hypothetical protein